MDERAVRAAVGHLMHEAHGLWLGIDRGECRLVPVTAIDALLDALGDPGEPDTDEPPDTAA